MEEEEASTPPSAWGRHPHGGSFSRSDNLRLDAFHMWRRLGKTLVTAAWWQRCMAVAGRCPGRGLPLSVAAARSAARSACGAQSPAGIPALERAWTRFTWSRGALDMTSAPGPSVGRCRLVPTTASKSALGWSMASPTPHRLGPGVELALAAGSEHHLRPVVCRQPREWRPRPAEAPSLAPLPSIFAPRPIMLLLQGQGQTPR